MDENNDTIVVNDEDGVETPGVEEDSNVDDGEETPGVADIEEEEDEHNEAAVDGDIPGGDVNTPGVNTEEDDDEADALDVAPGPVTGPPAILIALVVPN